MDASKLAFAGAILASIGPIGSASAYAATAIKCEGSRHAPSSFMITYEQQGHTFIIDDDAGSITRWVSRVGQTPVCYSVKPCIVKFSDDVIKANAKSGNATFDLTISRISGKISESYSDMANSEWAQFQGMCEKTEMPSSLEGRPRKF